MLIYITAIIIGLAYASILYVSNKKQHYSRFLTSVMFTLRTAVVSLIVLLLFNPYLKHKKNKIEQATIIIAQDNSMSLTFNRDSIFYKERYPFLLDSICDDLEEKFIVDKYLFGDKVRELDSIDYQDYYTDISEILNYIEKTYYKKNVGAVVLLSDGICNKSYLPEQNISSYPFPIYSVTLGDTTNYPDLYINNVRYNKTCRANIISPVQITANAVNCKDKSMEIEVLLDNDIIDNRIIHINSNRFSKTLNFNINFKDEGVKQIDVRIKNIEEESQTRNNNKRIFIEVIDKKYKVLCLAKSPHPDIASLKNILGDHFDFDITFFNNDIPNLYDYDLLILHQVPFLGMNTYASLAEQLKNNKEMPIFCMIGNDTDIERLNEIQSSIQVRKGAINSLLDVKAHYNQSFGLFNIDKENIEIANNFPPLTLPHLDIKTNGIHDILFYMNIMDMTTDTPLLSFATDNEGRKTAFLFGTEIWRWKYFNFYNENNFNGFDEIINKSIQYLLTDKDKELTIYHNESYLNNEKIIMRAEMRNPSQELFNDADLKINIRNKHNNDIYEYEFSKDDKSYILNVNTLGEGIYTYEAKAEYGGKQYSDKGTFSVVNVGAEAQDLVANARRMESLSTLTNGKNFNINEINQLAEALYNDERIHSIVREENNFIGLINIKSLLFIIITMISIEWFLRKYFS